MICVNVKLENKTQKKIIPAFSMIAIMLLSPQITLLLNTDDSPERDSRVEPPKRTAYQQLEQLGGSVQGGNQNSPSMMSQFQTQHIKTHSTTIRPHSTERYPIHPPWHSDPMYGFFLEETNTDDHDNDGIDDLNDLDDDNDGINDLIERFDGCFGTDPLTTIMMGLGTSLTGMTTMTGYWRAQSTTHGNDPGM